MIAPPENCDARMDRHGTEDTQTRHEGCTDECATNETDERMRCIDECVIDEKSERMRGLVHETAKRMRGQLSREARMSAR